LKTKIHELAIFACDNPNCSDIEDAIAEVLTDAVKEQDKRTRHACAEAIAQLSASVVAANSYRGRLNAGAVFAVELLSRAEALCMNTEAPH
jgi:hypothetical protein